MTSGPVGARARLLADVLAALFEHDRELAEQLNAAQRRVQTASERVGGELAGVIHRAFADYQAAAKRRRQLGADVGEASVRLIDAMHQDGYSEQQAARPTSGRYATASTGPPRSAGAPSRALEP